MIRTNASRLSDRVSRGRASVAACAAKACLAATWGALLLFVACGGSVDAGGYGGPLALECTQHSDCTAWCSGDVDCARDLACGFGSDQVGYCTVRCALPTRELPANIEACLSWGGQCSDIGGGHKWCRR